MQISPRQISKNNNLTMEILTALLLLINMLVIGDAPLSTVEMEQFGNQMAPYFEAAGHPTDTSNTSLHELPITYWGATVWSGRCTNQVFLSERFTDPNHPFFNTPMWKYVLAHEWAHVAQGAECADNEAEAQLIALAVLTDAGELDAVYTTLEWMLALSAAEDVQSKLTLTDRQTNYYQVVSITQLEPVEMLLADDDGIFELRSGRLDARNLWMLLQDLMAASERNSYQGAR
jgi:hypothetical protein